MNVLEILVQTGFMGVLILVCGVLAGAAIVTVFVKAQSRKPLVGMLVLALLPLGLGAAATASGFLQVEQAIAALPPELPPGLDREEIRAEGRRAAMCATYLGAAVTTPLLLFALALLAVKRPNPAKRQSG
jgi:hypothetical protein